MGTKEENEELLYERKEFLDIDFSGKELRNIEYYHCTFERCTFSKADLSNSAFEKCTFKACDFTMTVISNTGFRDVVLSECKLMGIDFAIASKFMFSFRFDKCYMNYCVFFGRNLKGTDFSGCTLKEVDFTEANLTSAIFTNADLTLSKFSNTNLEKADFRGAVNFSIEPEFNKVKKAKFSLLQLEGLLYKYQLDIDYGTN